MNKKQYSFNNLSGCVLQRKNRITGTTISVYNNTQADLDDENPWSTVCEEHHTICSHSSLRLAILHTTMPEWCEECMKKLEQEHKHAS